LLFRKARQNSKTSRKPDGKQAIKKGKVKKLNGTATMMPKQAR